MILYSSSLSRPRPLASSVTSFPCNDFFGMTYSDIGAKSSKAVDEGERERERGRGTGRERERDRDSSGREREVMRFSGTWWRTIGPR